MRPAFLVGFALFATGFALVFATLGAAGGLAKSRQLAVLGDGLRGGLGPGVRRRLRAGLLLLGAGALALFAGVAAGDAARARACRSTCAARGFASGRIRGSAERSADGKRHAFVACACEAPGREPLELRADDLAE